MMNSAARVAPTRCSAVVHGLWLTLTAGLLILSSACSSTGQEAEQVSREVAEVTTSIKAALVEAEDVDAAAIRIRLKGEAIWLDGFVDSEAESMRAETVAREQFPERKLINRIEIR